MPSRPGHVILPSGRAFLVDDVEEYLAAHPEAVLLSRGDKPFVSGDSTWGGYVYGILLLLPLLLSSC